MMNCPTHSAVRRVVPSADSGEIVMTDEKVPVHLTGNEARGGEIILRSRIRRWVFIAGLAGMVIVLLLAGFAGIKF
jgi:hypothetical protein